MPAPLLFPLLASLPALATLPTPEDMAAGEHRGFHGGDERVRRPAPPPLAAEDRLGSWDVTHVVLRVRMDPEARAVSGHATLDVSRRSPGPLVLHADGPDLIDVRVNGATVAVSSLGDELHVPDPGGDAQVDVRWSVSGETGADGGLRWGRTTYSFHEPEMARRWLVLRDVPADKFTLRWEIEAPEALVVAANGDLQASTLLGDGFRRWIWTFDQPIPTYLMAVHLSDYVQLQEDGPVPILAWVHPEEVEDATRTFASTGDMVAQFSSQFGPYPFERYGNATAPMGGAMEHTTVTTFGEGLLRSDWGEIVNAHELAHHWWGDDLTPATWADIWLNEGFASYAEVLWYERIYGPEGRMSYTQYQLLDYRADEERFGAFALYDPVYMWGGTVYSKGSLVLHQLRGWLGDERFFEVLRGWEAAHRFGTVETEDFLAVAEQISGEDLRAFFDGWVYTAGEPSWSWGWSAQPLEEGGAQVDILLRQDRPEFANPVVARLRYPDGSEEDVLLEVSGAEVAVSLCRPVPPAEVRLDPEGWVPLVSPEQVPLTTMPVQCGVDDLPDDAADSSSEASTGCGCGSAPFSGGLAALGLAAVGLLGVRRRQS